MNYEYEYKRRHRAMSQIPAFRQMPDSNLIYLGAACTMTEYQANKVRFFIAFLETPEI